MAGVMPLVAVRVLGVTYMVLGVNAVVTLATQWGQINEGFYFFQCMGFFLGKELLERREKARRTGVMIGSLGAALALLVGGSAAATGGTELPLGMTRLKLDDPFFRIVAASGFFAAAAFFIGQVYVLRRPAVREYFATPAEAPRYWVVLVPAVALVSLANAIPGVLINHWLTKVELKHATVEVFDEATGKQLSPEISYMDARSPGELFPQGFLRFDRDDKPSMEVIWVDSKPIEIGVSAQGYSSQKIRIDNDDRSIPRRIKLGRQDRR